MNDNNNIDVSVPELSAADLSVSEQPGSALARLRQPLLGSLALAAMIVLALALIGSFAVDSFMGWVTFWVVCAVPVQIVLAMLWGNQYPTWLNGLGQPARGLAQCLLTAIGATLIASAVYWTQAGQAAPTPISLMYVILCVLLTFWLVIVWEAWPLARLTRQPLALGLGVLALAYGLGYALFCAAFDFSGLAGAPFYRAALDPHGAFPAFEALAFAVTTVSVMFAWMLLGFWPLGGLPALARQPLQGLARSAGVLLLAAAFYGIGTRGLGIAPVPFMVHGAIALLFGALVPLLMFEGGLFAGRPPLQAGLLQLGVAIIAAIVLPRLYWLAAPWVSGPLHSGAPDYQQEFWLASALLAMTFPLLVVCSQFFDFWPLRRR